MRAIALCVCLAAVGCTEHPYVDLAMRSAYRPPHDPPLAAAIAADTPYVLLAGDLHCHVSPPDDASHANRNPEETLTLAQREGLDFVVLTPHVGARFFEDAEARAAFLDDQRRLREAVARSARAGLITVVGFEYTDHAWGHVGAAFADPERVLAEVPVDTAVDDPGRFFERWVSDGGVLTINHLLVTPVASSISIARADLSWRPWTAPDREDPPEIATIDRLAQEVEVYNLTAAHLRDHYALHDEDTTVRATLARMDRAIEEGARPIAPVGGSDSHSFHLRATTFVLAAERSEVAIRDALVAGRVCVRSPEACTMRVRTPGGSWSTPGAAVSTPGPVELLAQGAPIEWVANGVVVSRPPSGVVATIDLPPDRCTVLRARIGEGDSGPVYVNCPGAAFRTPR